MGEPRGNQDAKSRRLEDYLYSLSGHIDTVPRMKAKSEQTRIETYDHEGCEKWFIAVDGRTVESGETSGRLPQFLEAGDLLEIATRG